MARLQKKMAARSIQRDIDVPADDGWHQTAQHGELPGYIGGWIVCVPPLLADVEAFRMHCHPERAVSKMLPFSYTRERDAELASGTCIYVNPFTIRPKPARRKLRHRGDHIA